tara:strand:+ start:54 stop:1064 length:1011 start_codon:yes stop_codon:yes gene_type:complete
MMFEKNKILITGAGGFIGSHLTEKLVKMGYKVRAFIEYNSFNSKGWLDSLPKELDGQYETFFGDIRDANAVRKSMVGIDKVIHLAALIAIPYSYVAPDSYIDTNVKGTLNVLQASKDANIKRVLHTSTSEVYGTAMFVPITEEHPLQGQSPYSASKIGADQIAYSFFNSFQTPVVIVRPFNCYGPRQSSRAVIPTIIRQIQMGHKEIALGSVSPTRDFNYVEDITEAFTLALESEAGEGEVFNFGSNFEITIENTVKLISEIMGTQLNIILDKKRLRPIKSEVERLWADNNKAKKIFNWEPNHGSLEGLKLGLEKTVEWFSNPENEKFYSNETYHI